VVACAIDHRLSQVSINHLVGAVAGRTVRIVDISSSTAALANLGTGRLQAEVATKVLAKALDTQTEAASSLIEALSVSVPAGLTFSPAGLSAGRESRFIADL
jgi:hypothetical protein